MRGVGDRIDALRGLSLLATLGLIGAFTSVLYGLADVAGGTTEFGAAVALSLVGATLLARLLRPRHALLVAGVVLVGGMSWYLLSLPYRPELLPIVRSNLELLSGQSIHQIRRSSTWAIGVVPAPVFATWYFALRRWYGAALLVGGAMLGFVVLTGDATLPITLVGVLAGTAMLGLGDLDRHGGSIAGAEYVAVSLAIMVAIPLAVTVVPAGAGDSLSLVEGGGRSLEASLLETESQFTVAGSIELSPAVRFTIESDAGRYWKVDSYDRYTGQGWVRTGGSRPLSEVSLPYPPGPRAVITQRVEVESRLSSLPAAWRPIEVGEGIADDVRVTDLGDLRTARTLGEGETYRVTSAIPAWDDPLEASETGAYPPGIRDRYLQLPESTPDRIRELTAEVTANATTPAETAVAIERWLEANKDYSLDVTRPDENIADSFLFGMERGYCTYFATTMVTMLRSEGVPARLATGYTTGEQVGADRYVVRGLDAHSWVEVYVPDRGWVTFDPTPSGPRERAESQRIREARANNVTGVDTSETRESAAATTPAPSDPDSGETDDSNTNTDRETETAEEVVGIPDRIRPGGETGAGGSGLGELPSREDAVLAGILVLGLVAGARRLGVDRWLHRTVRVAWQRRVDPTTDVERALERAEIVLGRRYRPRRAGETLRQYVDSIDAPAPARELAHLYERAHYGDGADEAMADRAVELVARLREQNAGARRSRGPIL